METPRLTVALTFDHDAISDSVRRGDPPDGVVFERLDAVVSRWEAANR